MDNSLTSALLLGFLDELEGLQKEAQISRFIPSFLRSGRRGVQAVSRAATTPAAGGGWGELGYRLRHPIQGMARGWRGMAPLSDVPRTVAARSKAVRESGLKIPLTQKRIFQSGEHLAQLPQGYREAFRQKGTRGLFEEASRGGWTGEGRLTKYLPVGQKGMLTGFGLMGAHNVATAPEGERFSRGLGEALGTAGWAMSGGLSALPAAASWIVPGVAGSMVGGKVDKALAASKLKQLGLTSQQIGSLAPEQVSQLLQYHRQYMRGA